VITTKDTNTGDVTTVHFDLIKKKCQEKLNGRKSKAKYPWLGPANVDATLK